MKRIQFLTRMAMAVLGLGMFVQAATAAEAPATFDVAGLKFKRPANWEWIEVTGMRKAQLKVTDAAKKETAEVVYFHFGGDGGGTDANVKRWLSQFVEPRDEKNTKVEKTTVGSTPVTYVRAEGTYSSGMPGGPKTPLENYVMLGAIIEGKEGHVFIRYTSPKALATASEKEFKGMVESALK
ncbi:MAG TPA: hypothetical protein VGH19_20115 [Verrucomicrobiae bacterium]